MSGVRRLRQDHRRHSGTGLRPDRHGNLYTIRVVHKPTGSTGEFFTEFPVRCNTTRHAGVKATFVYDASLVESYNAEHKTSYAALPAEYLTLENTTLTVPENATASADSVKVTLTGNLSLLTERNYLAPLRIKAEASTPAKSWERSMWP